MNTRFHATLLVVTLSLAVGCGSDERVPTLDITQEDTLGQDVLVDSITPTDTTGTDARPDMVNVDTATPDTNEPADAEEDVPSTDVPGVDVSADDVPVTDVPAEDTVPTDVAPEDVPDSVTDTGADVGVPQTCTGNSDCDAESFCKADTCGGEGVCETMPELCLVPVIADIFNLASDNVCACDGIEYSTECYANMAGANVGAGANCGTGSECTTNGDCGATDYCKRDTCGAAQGVCAARPTSCNLILMPVCGCDGVTYSNECQAAANAQNVDTTGAACETVTTCTSNADCTEGFCYKTSCEAAAEGTCETAPALCLIVGSGICGCNGTTYTNECFAKQAGVSTDPTGDACDTTVTCTGNADCASTEYCKKASCTSTSGTCTAVPLKTCPSTIDPVCGCDGVVYPNLCKATKSRVNTQRITACGDGTTCTAVKSCLSRSEYCLSDECGGDGVCLEKPGTCESATYMVCGCNGTTYKNFCEAAKAGINVASEGRCSILN